MPVAHPGLMRLLDYKKYTRRRPSGIYALYEAPLRDKPSDNWSERMYQRLVRPMPGLLPEDERVFRYVAIYPNTVIDLYPDHVLIWKMNPAGVDRTGVPGAYLRRTDGDARTRARAVAEPADQPDHHPRGRGPGRTHAARPGQRRLHARARSPFARRAWPGSRAGSATTSASWES